MKSDRRTPAPMDSHWPAPAQLELADKSWDQIEEILLTLSEATHCSNAALRDLLTHISSTLLDPVEEVQSRIRRGCFVQRSSEPEA